MFDISRNDIMVHDEIYLGAKGSKGEGPSIGGVQISRVRLMIEPHNT